MRKRTFTVEDEFNKMCCSECGITFFYPTSWCERSRELGRSWHCPNGHSQWYGESENEKIRRERDRLKQKVAQVEDERDNLSRELMGAEDEMRRIKKRSKAGVCPCCNRTFKQLSAHMKNKHPEYGAD